METKTQQQQDDAAKYYCRRSSSLLGHIRGSHLNSRLARGQGLLENAEKGSTVHADDHRDRAPSSGSPIGAFALHRPRAPASPCSGTRVAVYDRRRTPHSPSTPGDLRGCEPRQAHCAVTKAGRSSRSKRNRGYDEFIHCGTAIQKRISSIFGPGVRTTIRRSPCCHWTRSGDAICGPGGLLPSARVAFLSLTRTTRRTRCIKPNAEWPSGDRPQDLGFDTAMDEAHKSLRATAWGHTTGRNGSSCSWRTTVRCGEAGQLAKYG